MLALCEDVPMAGIGVHFFVQKYAIPTFQVTRLLSRRTHWVEPRALLL